MISIFVCATQVSIIFMFGLLALGGPLYLVGRLTRFVDWGFIPAMSLTVFTLTVYFLTLVKLLKGSQICG